MKRFLSVVMISLIITLLADSVLAWDIKSTLQRLVENSPLIITGKVTGVSSSLETEKKREVVYTYVTIETESILKGELEKPALTVKMLGGRLGSKGGWSEEWVPLDRDEEVLLFLHSKDQTNNIWEIKSISSKLSLVNINGIKHFDCSMLRTDEVSQYDTNSYFEEKVIIDRINGYILLNKGGK